MPPPLRPCLAITRDSFSQSHAILCSPVRFFHAIHLTKHQAAAELEQAPERAWRWWRDEWSRPSSPYPAGAFAAASLPPPPQPQAPVLLLRLCRRQPPAPRAVGRWLAEERAELALVETTPSPSGSQQEGAAGVDVMVRAFVGTLLQHRHMSYDL